MSEQKEEVGSAAIELLAFFVEFIFTILESLA
jgi:hypothetical protein